MPSTNCPTGRDVLEERARVALGRIDKLQERARQLRDKRESIDRMIVACRLALERERDEVERIYWELANA